MKKLIFFIIGVFAFGYELKQFVVCRNIKHLTPVNITNKFTVKDKKVYAFAYFTNIKQNKIINFLWEEYANNQWNIYADIKLPLHTGYRWRTFSDITVRKFFTGKWKVSIFDGNKTISSKKFIIQDINSSDNI